MASQTYDGTFSSPTLTGAAKVEFPWQNLGEYYARSITRELVASSTAYAANYVHPSIALTSWTNSLLYSEVLTNAAWTATNITVTDNQTTNPADGQATMSKLLETVTNAEHRISQAVTFTAVPWTISACIKGGLTRTVFYLRANDGSTSFSGYFDISTSAGSVGTLAAGTTGAITALGNGAYRISITFTPAAAAGNAYFNVASSGSVISYAGTTSAGMYVWGCEAKAASSAGPYVSTTSTARTISAPAVDIVDLATYATLAPGNYNVGDPFAYLMTELSPSGLDKGMARWQRVYSRIPKTITVQSSMAITKPAVPNQSTGTLAFYKQGTSSDDPVSVGSGSYYNGYLWTVGNEMYGTLKSVTYTGATTSSGGTFTVTFGANTTAALNDNETAANIATAINALASVSGAGITVSVSANGFRATNGLVLTLTAGSTSSRFTVNGTSLTGVSVAKVFTNIESSTKQTLYLASKYGIAGHGFAGTELLAMALSTVTTASTSVYIVQPTTSWSVIDSNNIAVIPQIGSVPTSITLASGSLFGKYLRSYTPGPDRVAVKLVTNFYLPGVTAGITAATDIPIPAPLINDADFLAAVVANTSGYLNYDADPLQLWLGTIYFQTQKQINMADV